MVEVNIPCNERSCAKEVDSHFYCDNCFEEKIEEARKEGREEVKNN